MPGQNVLTKPLSPRIIQTIQIIFIATLLFLHWILSNKLRGELLTGLKGTLFFYFFLSALFTPLISLGLHLLSLIMLIIKKLHDNNLVISGWILIALSIITLPLLSGGIFGFWGLYLLLPITWIFVGIMLLELFYFFRTLLRKKNLNQAV